MIKCCLKGLLIAGILHIGVHLAAAETIRMGYFEIRPHIYTSETTGLPAGAIVTFFNVVVKKMGYDVIWVGPLPHARLVNYLETGNVIDGDPIMSMTAERKKFLYFPENHFYLAKPNFVVMKNNPLTKIDSADDVSGYVVGQFSKAAHSKFVIKNKSLFTFDIVSTGKFMVEQQLNKLVARRVDAIHTLDEFSLFYEAKRLGMDAQIKVLPLPEAPLPFYSVFCKNEKGKRLAQQFDRAIKELGFTSDHYIELIQHEFNALDKKMSVSN
jgi:ABC-type amino acid transport substrate-binding protein